MRRVVSVRLRHRLLGLGTDLVVEIVTVGHPAAGIEQGEVVALPFGIDRLAVAGDPRPLFDDGLAPAEDAVDEGGLAHTVATHQAHALAFIDLERNVFQQRGLTESPAHFPHTD